MKFTQLIPLFSLLLFMGCTATDSADTGTSTQGAKPLTPFDAVVMANEFADKNMQGFASTFVFDVKGMSKVGEHLFLHSRADYRHPFSLNVDIYPITVTALEEQLGGDLETLLLNKKVQVVGVPQRQKVGFLHKGEATDEYYYQTRVKVLTINQLSIID